MDRGRFDHLSYVRIHGLCRCRGYNRRGDFFKTRLALMEDGENRRILIGGDALDASVTATGKRGRPPADAVEALNCPTYTQNKRYRADALRLALVVDKEVVDGRSQWWVPELKSRVGATRSSAAGGVDAARWALVAGARNRNSGQELSEEGGQLHVDLARDAEYQDAVAWKQWKNSKPLREGINSKSVVDTRWAPA